MDLTVDTLYSLFKISVIMLHRKLQSVVFFFTIVVHCDSDRWNYTEFEKRRFKILKIILVTSNKKIQLTIQF